MKVQYKKGRETVELETSEAVAEVLVTYERQDDSARRKARRRNEASVDGMFEETGWEPTDAGANVEAEVEAREETETLAAAVAKLDEKQRRIVQLKYYEGMTDAEIAEILGVSRPAVTQQVATIHKTLKKYLEDF